MKQNYQKQKKQVFCRLGVTCQNLQYGRCRDPHPPDEEFYISTINELNKINTIIGVLSFEDSQKFIIPQGKYFFWDKAIILNVDQSVLTDHYYEAKFVYFEFRGQYPIFQLLDKIGKIGSLRSYGILLVYYNRFYFPEYEEVPERSQGVMKGIYRVLFGNQHVIKSDSIQKKLFFQNYWDRNRAFDNSEVLFRMVDKESATIVKIIKNPLLKMELVGLIGIGTVDNPKGNFNFEARINSINKSTEKIVDIQICMNNFQYGVYFISLNPLYPTFRVVGVSQTLFQQQNLLYKFVVGRFVEWNRKSESPWIEIIDEEQSISKIKNYQRAILQRNHVNTDQFPNRVEQEVKGVVEQIVQKLNKKDISSKEIIFSIDNQSTKLIDDALSIKFFGEKSFQLTVFIADPTQFIKQKNLIYQECQNRFESCYIQNFYQPMMPKELTKLLSLNQDEKRFAVSIQIVVNNGVPDYENLKLSYELIENKHKLNYAIVEDYLTNRGNKINNDNLEKCLRWALEISEQIKKQKDSIQCLNSSQDDEFQYPLAENMVQTFMLLTNEAIGYYVDSSQKKFTEMLKQIKSDMNKIIELEYQVKKRNIDILRIEEKIKIYSNIYYQPYPKILIFEQEENEQKEKKMVQQNNQKKSQKKSKQSYQEKNNLESGKSRKNKQRGEKQQFDQEGLSEELKDIEANIEEEENHSLENKSQRDDSEQSSTLDEQPSLIEEEPDSDSSYESKEDLFEINYSKLEYQDAERNINYFNDQILSKFGLRIDLESQQLYKKSKEYVFSKFNKDQVMMVYMKFLFKVKDKYIKVLINEKEQQAKKQKLQMLKNLKDQKINQQKEAKQIKLFPKKEKQKTAKKQITNETPQNQQIKNNELEQIEIIQIKEPDELQEISDQKQQNNWNQINKEENQKFRKQRQPKKQEKNSQKKQFKESKKQQEDDQIHSERIVSDQLIEEITFQLESVECNRFSNFSLAFLFCAKYQCMELDYSLSNTQFENSYISYTFVTNLQKYKLLEEIQEIKNEIINSNKEIECIKTIKSDNQDILFNSENNCEIMLKYSNLPENKKMKFTSPLRRFHDLMVHYLIGYIINLEQDIKDVIIQSDNQYEQDILMQNQNKMSRRRRNQQKLKMKEKSEYYKDAYKLIQSDVENIKMRKQKIIEVISSHKDIALGSIQKAQREIGVLQICQQIMSKNSSKNVQALITSINKGKRQVQVFFVTDNIEMEEILEFDQHNVQFEKYDTIRLFVKGERREKEIILQPYDKCYVSLDCSGVFPLQLCVFFDSKIQKN